MAKRRLTPIDIYIKALESLKTAEKRDYVLISGDEPFLVDRLSREALVSAKKSFGVDTHDRIDLASESGSKNQVFRELLDLLSSSGSLFSSKRVVLIKGLERIPFSQSRKDKDRDQSGVLLNVLDKTCASGDLIICVSLKSLAESNPLAKFFKERGIFVSLPQLREYHARDVYDFFNMYYLKGRGQKISIPNFKNLLSYTGMDLFAIESELDKLSMYIGERNEISANDIEAVCVISRDAVMYELQDSFGERDNRGYVRNLTSLLDRGVRPSQIISAISRRAGQLRLAKEISVKERLRRGFFDGLAYYEVNDYISSLKGKYSGDDAGRFDDLLSLKGKFLEKLLMQSCNFEIDDLEYVRDVLADMDFKSKMSDKSATGDIFILVESLKRQALRTVRQ